MRSILAAFCFFKSLPFIFSFCLSGIIGGSAPLLSVLSFPKSSIGNPDIFILKQFRFLIETFRNDGRGGSFSGLFLIFFFCLYVSCFFGGYKGGFAPYCRLQYRWILNTKKNHGLLIEGEGNFLNF